MKLEKIKNGLWKLTIDPILNVDELEELVKIGNRELHKYEPQGDNWVERALDQRGFGLSEAQSKTLTEELSKSSENSQ